MRGLLTVVIDVNLFSYYNMILPYDSKKFESHNGCWRFLVHNQYCGRATAWLMSKTGEIPYVANVWHREFLGKDYELILKNVIFVIKNSDIALEFALQEFSGKLMENAQC